MSKLVLTRKAGQSVKIGKSLVLTVRDVRRDKVYIDMGDKCYWFTLGGMFSFGNLSDVTICTINFGVVKLLFEADRSVAIVRTELLHGR